MNGGHGQNHNFGGHKHLTVREIQKILGMLYGNVVAHLRDASYVSRMDMCRTERQEPAALGCMELVAQKEQRASFFEEDEKRRWITYNNIKRKRS